MVGPPSWPNQLIDKETGPADPSEARFNSWLGLPRARSDLQARSTSRRASSSCASTSSGARAPFLARARDPSPRFSLLLAADHEDDIMNLAVVRDIARDGTRALLLVTRGRRRSLSLGRHTAAYPSRACVRARSSRSPGPASLFFTT